MHGIHGVDVHVPVDAVAGIPARRGLLGVVGPDGNDVVGAVQSDIIRNIVVQGQIAHGPVAQQVLVDPHVAVGHDASELDIDPLPGKLAVKLEVFAVPARPAAEIAAAPLHGAVLVIVVLDPPIVGHIEDAPRGIIESRAPGVFGVTAQELPFFVDVDGRSGFSGMQAKGPRSEQNAEQNASDRHTDRGSFGFPAKFNK